MSIKPTVESINKKAKKQMKEIGTITITVINITNDERDKCVVCNHNKFVIDTVKDKIIYRVCDFCGNKTKDNLPK